VFLGAFGPMSKNLIPRGDHVIVSNDNRLYYMYRVVNHRLKTQIQLQTEAFLSGLTDIMTPRLLKLFTYQEFSMLLSGSSAEININDWKSNTVYNAPFSESHPTIIMFWKFMGSLKNDERSLLLAFATGYNRAPLLGFSSLAPFFCIATDPVSDDHLPTASTCANMLRMPAYASYEILSLKFRKVIVENSGFHLS
jgi:ubiquitin-protein ligase E3 C